MGSEQEKSKGVFSNVMKKVSDFGKKTAEETKKFVSA